MSAPQRAARPIPFELVFTRPAPEPPAAPVEPKVEPAIRPTVAKAPTRRLARQPAAAPAPRRQESRQRAPRPQTRAERRRATRHDPVESLRASMGWKDPKTPSGTTARSSRPGRPAPERWSSAAEIADPTMGAYITTIEALLAARWAAAELPIRQRALGIQGHVEVRYTIQTNGTIRDRAVVRSSGIANLDRLALETLPHRFPRLPRGREAFEHKVTFQYSNPLLAPRRAP